MSFRGTYTAIITPFREGKIDVAAYKNLSISKWPAE
jgi:dihydrodipicolinate synthase/N-acetylneuraminate lyase